MVSEELKKMFDGRIALQDMHYVGKACYGKLEENLRGKLELELGFLAGGYSRISVSVLERTSGLVDQMKFLISDVTGLKVGADGRPVCPALSSYEDSSQWNCEMGEADYQKIAAAVNGYLSLFQSEELVHGQEEQVGALPGNVLT